MSPSPLRVIRSRRVVTPHGVLDTAVHIRDGRIERVDAGVPAHAVTEDLGSLVLMPGLVDTHVHINEPGRTEWEGFSSATDAAAAGGVTTLIDMPLNSSPVTTSVASLASKRAAAEGKLRVDCGFYGGLVPGSEHEMGPLADAGVLGVKAFLVHSGIDDFPASGERELRLAMPALAAAGIPLLVHCEIAPPGEPRPMADPASYAEYAASRPPSWECGAIALLARLAHEFSCKAHVVHVSSSDAIPLIGRLRGEGIPLSAETCPHYLTFAAEEIPDGDTRYKCAPPIRGRAHRERLWDALREGVLDFVVSDHSPSPPSMKMRGDFQRSWGGIASLQFGLPAVWTEARRRGFGIEEVARWMSARPAAFAGLRKGAIAPGFDADLTAWDPDAAVAVEPSTILFRHRMTPYEGRPLAGAIRATWLRGEAIFRDGAFTGAPAGRIITRT